MNELDILEIYSGASLGIYLLCLDSWASINDLLQRVRHDISDLCGESVTKNDVTWCRLLAVRDMLCESGIDLCVANV